MRPTVFDTGALRNFFFVESPRERILRSLLTLRHAHIPSVVFMELYAGTRTRDEKEAIDLCSRIYSERDRVLVPTRVKWNLAGICLSRAKRVYGEMDIRHHFRDVLIAILAARVRGVLATGNPRDFERWKKILKRGGADFRITVVS